MSQIHNFNHDKITTAAGRVAMTSLLSKKKDKKTKKTAVQIVYMQKTKLSRL